MSYIYRLDYSDSIIREDWDVEDDEEEAEEEDDDEQYEDPSKASVILVADDDRPPLLLNAQMFSAADYFGIEGLKNLAKEKFEDKIKTQWNCASLPNAIEEIYGIPKARSQTIRHILVKYVHKHYGKLKVRPDFDEVLEKAQGLGGDLYKRFWTESYVTLPQRRMPA